MKNEVKVVGAGIVGCILARRYAENGYDVQLIERRSHIAGNLYDYYDKHGVRVQKYGPHIFHTCNENVFQFINRYSDWENFRMVCGAVIDGICTPTAFNLKTIDLFYAEDKARELKKHIREKYGNRESATVVELLDSEDEIIRNYAQFLFDKDYSLYTAKQWGISPNEIDKSVLKRVPIRFTYEEAYFKDKYECMPVDGFTNFVSNIIGHPQIQLILNEDAMKHIKIVNNSILWDDIASTIIYTGPLDELFGYCYGRLPYRSLRFEWRYDRRNSIQDMPVVAYPQAEKYTRITEYKKLPVQNVEGTSYAIEYPIPYVPGREIEPYYPVLTDESKKLYDKYEYRAKNIEDLIYCGRLAEFKYYDMDQAIERAINISNKELSR